SPLSPMSLALFTLLLSKNGNESTPGLSSLRNGSSSGATQRLALLHHNYIISNCVEILTQPLLTTPQNTLLFTSQNRAACDLFNNQPDQKATQRQQLHPDTLRK